MRYNNSVTLTGRLTKDVEVREYGTDSNKWYTTYGIIAVDDGYFDKKTNKYIDKTIYVPIRWGRKIDPSRYSKGNLISLLGKVQYDNYEDNTTKERKIFSYIKVASSNIVSFKKGHSGNQNGNNGEINFNANQSFNQNPPVFEPSNPYNNPVDFESFHPVDGDADIPF